MRRGPRARGWLMCSPGRWFRRLRPSETLACNRDGPAGLASRTWLRRAWHCELRTDRRGSSVRPTYGFMRATTKPGWIERQCRAAAAASEAALPGDRRYRRQWRGPGRNALGLWPGVDDFAYITVGTGVGAALIVNGKPTRGLGHCELGHIRVARSAGDYWGDRAHFMVIASRGWRAGRRFGPGLATASRSFPPTIRCGTRSPGR